jgi:hypothetical protein
MLLSRITKYELDMPHDEKVEFSMEELIAFIIWLVQAYHEKVPPLVFGSFHIRREGEVIRINDCQGGLAVGNVPGLVSEMNTLMPYFTFPSVMSIPERTINAVRYNGDVLGYFDGNNESLLPVALKKIPEVDKFYENKVEHFVMILGEKYTGKANFSRYRFKDIGKE